MKQFKALPPKWQQFLSLYGVLIVASLVSINQLRLRHEGISSWKGGGFGMYADMHPVYNKLFIKSRSGKVPTTFTKPTDRAVDLMAKVQIYPHDSYLKQLKSEYSNITGIDDLTIQVWVPVFDPDSAIFKLKLKKDH